MKVKDLSLLVLVVIGIAYVYNRWDIGRYQLSPSYDTIMIDTKTGELYIMKDGNFGWRKIVGSEIITTKMRNE